ncbi:uncharacterized protein LOC119675049 isoform X1 [Teleopsis dalmanni]|uniref:uncharacterized protein LOC119675049 isoform X1 n=2 Tax=Teleopsis dalmanni TaxID=139649 RepID=UPI0018CF1634|nr:uncharacterized protein LOC119675049 isoform X1 [Teleopsis dalmanni]
MEFQSAFLLTTGQRFLSEHSKLREKIKMWMPAEETALVNFLKENVEFEKPTSRVYYNRFLQSSGVDADWKIVRLKVLNMRKTYKKTKEWLDTVGEAMADDESVGNAIRNMCPLYYDIEKVFGSNFINSPTKSNRLQPIIVKSESISDQNFDDASNTIVKTENEEFENVYDNMQGASQDRSFSLTETMSSHAENHCTKDVFDNNHSTKCSGAYFGTAVSEMVQSHAESLKLKKKKMDIDSNFREKEMQLLERQVAVQEKEIAFKEMELKSQEYLKILELEMKERIAMKELELKYKKQ